MRRGRYPWFWTLDGCCYFAKGYRGQYVFVDLARDVVVVRFGEGYGQVNWTALFRQMAASLDAAPAGEPGEPDAPAPRPALTLFVPSP